jgi:hypothetical protein
VTHKYLLGGDGRRPDQTTIIIVCVTQVMTTHGGPTQHPDPDIMIKRPTTTFSLLTTDIAQHSVIFIQNISITNGIP